MAAVHSINGRRRDQAEQHVSCSRHGRTVPEAGGTRQEGTVSVAFQLG